MGALERLILLSGLDYKMIHKVYVAILKNWISRPLWTPKNSKFGVLPQISTFTVPKSAEKSKFSKLLHILFVPPYNLALISKPAFQVLQVLGVGVNGGKCGQVSGFK